MNNIRIDIVSDIVCPWCVIGYKRLERVLNSHSSHIKADIHWHPFELNPAMPIQGQNLREHLAEKYDTTREASTLARKTLTQLGQEVDFEFQFFDEMRIFNTRKAHQLLLWAQDQDKQSLLMTLLFQAYFTQRQDISNPETLIGLAQSIGLDLDTAQHVLLDESWANTVLATERQWLDAGIQAVPAFILNQKHLISGAQTEAILTRAICEITKQESWPK
ncbi:DsbA family oxidoreductase [Vibrio sinensis]|uniref:DsbA family oxidoreductase n=1 Tax=Vibrio sinensis TaxID=2302434 RepID=A0A3A6QAT4_9VIBR|nr:DsbA family oxidoreductase [Vibrio sinensis]RJX68932.1 DsbA family oxidoreductase [Vibrio sinensis]